MRTRVSVAISREASTVVRVRRDAVENVREKVISDDPAELKDPFHSIQGPPGFQMNLKSAPAAIAESTGAAKSRTD